MTRQKQTFLGWIGSIFLNGLIAILPITLTIGLFTFAFKQVIRWLEPLKLWLIKHHYLIQIDPQSSIASLSIGRFSIQVPYIEVILVGIIIFVVGLVSHNMILKPLINALVHSLERLVSRVPLLRSVYGGIKQLVQAFTLQDKLTFKQVVYVEFPRHGIYSIGFLTSELPAETAPTHDHRYYNVFIPTTPNPTSGFFVIVSEQQLMFVSLSRQEAMAMIISGGIIQPERYTMNNQTEK